MASQQNFSSLSDYSLLQTFSSQGRSGVVWRAQNSNGINVVIKIPDFNETPVVLIQQRKEINTEIEVLQQLAEYSPPVVRLLDVGKAQHAGEYYLFAVLEELSEKNNLSNIITEDYKKNAILPILELLEIFLLVLETLQHAHKNQLVYNDAAVKHIFWDRDILINRDGEKYKRLRIIDWANSIRTSDPKVMLKDIEHAGKMLSDMFSLAGLKEFRDTHAEYHIVEDLIGKLNDNEYQNISELIIDVIREVNALFSKFISLLEDMDRKFDETISINGTEDHALKGLFEQSTNIEKAYHLSSLDFDKFWNIQIYKILQNMLLSLERNVQSRSRSSFDDDIDKFQNYASQLRGATNSVTKIRVLQLADYMRISIRNIFEIQDHNNLKFGEEIVTRITQSWNNLLNFDLSTSRVLHQFLKDIENFSYSDWLQLSKSVYLLCHVFEIEETNWPLDVALARRVFDDNPLSMETNKDIEILIISNHNAFKSNVITAMNDFQDRFPLDLNTYFDYAAYFKQVTRAVETIQKLENYQIVDYWHRTKINKIIGDVNQLFSHRRHIRSQNPLTDNHNGISIKNWLDDYYQIVDEWELLGGNASNLKETLDDFQSVYENLQIGIEYGDLDTLRSAYSMLLRVIKQLCDQDKEEGISISVKDIDAAHDLQGLLDLWEKRLAPETNQIRDIVHVLLDTEVQFDRFATLVLDSDIEELSTKYLQFCDDLNENELAGIFKLGHPLQQLKRIVNFLKYKGIDNELPKLIKELPESSFRASLSTQFKSFLYINHLLQVTSFADAKFLLRKMTSGMVKDDVQLSAVKNVIGLINEIETSWEKGDFDTRSQVDRLQRIFQQSHVLRQSKINDFVHQITDSFTKINDCMKIIRSHRNQVVAKLISKYRDISDNTTFDDETLKIISNQLKSIIELCYEQKLVDFDSKIWYSTFLDIQRIAIDSERIDQIPKINENDPLRAEYKRYFSNIVILPKPWYKNSNYAILGSLLIPIIGIVAFLTYSNFQVNIFTGSESSLVTETTSSILSITSTVTSEATNIAQNPTATTVPSSTITPTATLTITPTNTNVPTSTSTSSPTPIPTSAHTPFPSPTPRILVDFTNEFNIQNVLGELDISGQSLSPFMQPLFDYYFQRNMVTILDGRGSAGTNTSQFEARTNALAGALDSSYVSLPIHVSTISNEIDIGNSVPSFRVSGIATLGEASSYVAINAITVSSLDSVNEVNTIWLIARNNVDEISESPFSLVDISVALTDPSLPIPSEIYTYLSELDEQFILGGTLAPYLSTYLSPIPDNLIREVNLLENVNFSRFNLGFAPSTDGNINVLIEQEVFIEIEIPYGDIEQFTIVTDGNTPVELDIISLRNE